VNKSCVAACLESVWMAVESVSGCSWNECPDQRGITVRMCVEWVSESAWNPQPTIAKALTRLETEGLIQRKAQALRKGSSILICGWLESKSWAKIPKRWLYDGSFGSKILMLTEFNFSRASLSALKVYIALLAYRDSNRGGIAMLSYDRLALITGVKRHHIADAITRLYDLRMISFRQGDFSEASDFSRTNRYLVRGLGVRWTKADEFEMPQSSAHKNRPGAADIAAANSFVSTSPKVM
jgi:hypothetical protein